MRPMILAAILAGACAHAQEAERQGIQVEKWPNGKKKIVCSYQKGVLHGEYREYGEQGELIKECTYRDGRIEGTYKEFFPSGAPRLVSQYRGGVLSGKLAEVDEAGQIVRTEVFVDGHPQYARSVAEIAAEITRLKSDIGPSGDPFAAPSSHEGQIMAGRAERSILDRGLAHLRVYRYLAGVNYKDLTLSDEYIKRTQHAVVALAASGGKPGVRPPGASDEFFKIAEEGMKYSCMHDGGKGLPDAIDHWMKGARPSNIIHRRWLLNVGMKSVGFGVHNKYTACWAVDRGINPAPAFEYVAYPVAGYQPVECFGSDWGWNLSLHPRKYAKPDPGQVTVVLQELDERYCVTGQPLDVGEVKVNTEWLGVPLCIWFEPKGVVVEPGRKYSLTVSGLKKDSGGPAKISYVIEFCALPK